MPYSSNEGKDWLAERIWAALRGAPERADAEGNRLAPRVLDIGAGSGTYADLLVRTDTGGARHYPHETAIEIYPRYVHQYRLRRKYDEVIIGDAREVGFPDSDVVILGDVLEHMSFGQAKEVWAKARAAATTAVFLSLPVVEWPQGAVNGNAHEAHVHTWSHTSVIAHLPGVAEWWVGPTIGVYRALPSVPGVRS